MEEGRLQPEFVACILLVSLSMFLLCLAYKLGVDLEAYKIQVQKRRQDDWVRDGVFIHQEAHDAWLVVSR